MELVNSGKVPAGIVAKLDRLTRSVKDLCALLELRVETSPNRS
jgi:DNA invertase Pin-like site-specific DNA recombinase